MKAEVFLREEKKFKSVEITDPAKPEISDDILSRWQNIINIITDVVGVSAGLIMKINSEAVELFLKSKNENNPYEIGSSEFLGNGLYSETVIGKNKELYINNALEEIAWKDNPAVDLNMISYFGLPIKWPDKERFGVICILDDKLINLDKRSRRLLEEYRNVIEDDLNSLIKKQKARLNFIIEGTGAATWEWNLQTEKTVFNDRWAEILGYKPEELKPTTIETWEKYTHPEDLKKAKAALEKHLNHKKEFYSVEIRMKHKDGHWIWVNDRGKVTSWSKDNKPLKMFGIFIDITARKKKEQKITEAKELIEDLTNQAPGTLYQYKLFPDGSSCFPYASEGIYEIYEVTPAEVIEDAAKVFARIHPDDYDQVVNSIQKSAETLNIWHDKYRVILPKQGKKWVEGRAKPEKMEDGSIIWHGNIREITDDKTNKILETAIDGFFMADAEGRIININQAFEDILGYSRDEIIGRKIPYFEKRENKYEVKDHIKYIKAAGSDRFETVYKNKAGEKINIEVSVTYLNLDTETDLFFAFVRDITERKKNQQEIRKIKERLELAVEGGNIGIWDWNIKTGEAYFSKNWFKMIGYQEGELNYNVESWEKLIHPDDKNKVNREINKFLNGEIKSYISEHRIKTKAGNYKWIKDIGKVSRIDKNGKPVRAVGIHLDIDKEKKSRRQVEYLSYQDSLTGLYNYRYLMEEIDRISNSRKYPISIVIADLDKLKFINDNFGHKMGDQYIKKAADILKNTFRQEDVVSRIGGDEFAAILPDASINEAQNIIGRVKKQFKIIRENNKEFKFFNISLGVSTIENSSMSFEQGYKKADKKMYEQKFADRG
jgi:diguanylate cyclase (GGDEF)-like protein/PAS domain S-box-containing protein